MVEDDSNASLGHAARSAQMIVSSIEGAMAARGGVAPPGHTPYPAAEEDDSDYELEAHIDSVMIYRHTKKTRRLVSWEEVSDGRLARFAHVAAALLDEAQRVDTSFLKKETPPSRRSPRPHGPSGTERATCSRATRTRSAWAVRIGRARRAAASCRASGALAGV